MNIKEFLQYLLWLNIAIIYFFLDFTILPLKDFNTVLFLISRFKVKGPGNYWRKNNGMVYLRAQGLISIMSPRAYFNNKHKGLF